MKVYRLDQNEEYAAQKPCGIFSTKEKAINAAIAKCKKSYTIIGDIVIGVSNYKMTDMYNYWWYNTNYYGDEPSFYITEIEVQ